MLGRGEMLWLVGKTEAGHPKRCANLESAVAGVRRSLVVAVKWLVCGRCSYFLYFRRQPSLKRGVGQQPVVHRLCATIGKDYGLHLGGGQESSHRVFWLDLYVALVIVGGRKSVAWPIINLARGSILAAPYLRQNIRLQISNRGCGWCSWPSHVTPYNLKS
jgi:hypothetical protein